jgi:hypothetical protein
MATRDITEGRGSSTAGIGRSIAIDLGIVSSTSTWQNTNESYDVAVGGLPFFYAIGDARPYIRQTAPFRKDQFDNGNQPGEQSLTGWWMRSQLSFHGGTGIKFYDPIQSDEIGHYRFADSNNADVWTQGEVTLLKETANMTGVTTGVYKLLSIVDGSTNKILGWTPANTTIKNYTPDGTSVTYSHVVTAGLDTATLAIATDGAHLFVADNDHIYTGSISTPASGYSEYYNTGSEKVVLAWAKQRLVGCIGVSVYELTANKSSSHTLPTPLYTHPNADWTWSSISEGGSAIYTAGYAGGNSAIYKFVLSTTTGSMPTLTSGIVAAQLPIGEIVYKIESYLGYLMIGTNKGMRVARISDTTGDLLYGPLIFEDPNGVRDFTFRDKFVWAAGTVNGYAGLYRIDLGTEIEPLRFAYAKDAYLDGATGYATSVDFVGNTDQIAFTTSGSNGIAIQSATVLSSTGWVKTGKIRYGTLEPKNFKRLLARGTFTAGELTLASISTDNAGVDVEYDHITYNSGVPAVEVTTSSPELAQEFLAYKFTLNRSASDTTTGPTFKGYQAKATIATPRQRMIKFPVWCFDVETDRFNTVVGYEGRAYARIQLLEEIEKTGDVLTWQDLTTGESQQAVIEQVTFTRMTPPDKRFDGFGGVIEITVRTV